MERLAALYSGSFTIESDPGTGTKATVRLPGARPGSQTANAMAADVRDRMARILGAR